MSRRTRLIPLGFVLVGALAACSETRESRPTRTATEQLLISSAIERSADRMVAELPEIGRVFVAPVNLESDDGRYAVAAIRDSLLRHGARLADERANADTIVEVRAGALSIDDADSLIGLSSMTVPVPMSDSITVPEFPLFKMDTAQGVAVLAGTAYDPADGDLVASTGPQYGFAHKTDWTVMLLVSWQTDDLPPPPEAPLPLPWE